MYLCQFVPFLISIIGFLVPQNIGLATKMVILGHLEAEILRNSQFTVAIFKNPRWLPYRLPGKWKHVFPD